MTRADAVSPELEVGAGSVDGVVDADASCNPGGPCIAYLDAKRIGYVDSKWFEHLLAHAREGDEATPDA